MPTRGRRTLADTSAAVPYVLRGHPRHDSVSAALSGRPLGLSGHAAYETFSVLTRLPDPYRLTPQGAGRVIASNFAATAHLSPEGAAAGMERMAASGIAGGAVYDALVALAAIEHDALLATCDARALRTYQALGARVELLS